MLAGQYFRSLNPLIIESQSSLPNNHKALLRFRTDSVSTLTGIPFKKVQVHKMINYKESHFNESNLFLNNLYSRKVTGEYRDRSSINLSSCSRYIAPSNFIDLLSNGLNIECGKDALDYIPSDLNEQPIISTMPVHILANMLGKNLKCDLRTKQIYTITATIDEPNCDLYQTVYYPNPSLDMYRMSITGNRIIAEFTKDYFSKETSATADENAIQFFIKHFLEIDFGMSDVSISNIEKHHQVYGKLIPCDTNEVKEFIHWASISHGIFSLGRWGTHRQLLMDDVVSDIKVIDNLIRSKGYSR
jgi:hypothetical protein